MEDKPDALSAHERPQWLGSLARRGVGRREHGWREPERGDVPRWLGSVARREGRTQIPPSFDARDPEMPRWLGSEERRRFTLPPAPPEPAPESPAPDQTVVPLPERKSQPASAEHPQTPGTATGDLGMTLRVA
ncbi:MAG: hypothetical protein ACXVZ1_10680 [Gaiellaceae bacterium]